MAEFKAIALSEIHIGSGQTLKKHLDFELDKKIENGKTRNIIEILDINELFKFIGSHNIEKFITSFIDKGERVSLTEFIEKNFSNNKKVSLSSISKREFYVYGNDLGKYNSLKEQLTNSSNLPIIPGSSLKGAIRTAIVSFLVDQNIQDVKTIFSTKLNNHNDLEKNEETTLNKLLSGVEKNEFDKNIMRFLTVGDIEFENKTFGIVQEIVNLYNNKWNLKKGRSSLVEVIRAGNKSKNFRININNTLISKNEEMKNLQFKPQFYNSYKDLLTIVNNHTKELLQSEINFWCKQKKESKVSDDLNIIDLYIENLKKISNEFNNLNEGQEAIIRLGGNSGWESITGGWAKKVLSTKDWNTLYHKLNRRREVSIFPKTRKIGSKGEVMGFLKISMVSN